MAQQLLKDFPDQFEALDGSQNPLTPVNASVANAEIVPSDENGPDVEPTDTGVPAPTAKRK